MKSPIKKPTLVRRPGMYLAFGLLILVWFFTGGIAIQRVERFDSLGNDYISSDEQINVFIVGTQSEFDIPFVFHSFRQTAPFFLEFDYNNYGSNPPTSVRLTSARVSGAGHDSTELILSGKPL